MNRELIYSTLFARLTSAPVVFKFTADLTVDDRELGAVSDDSGLFAGMPITGRGIAEGTVIASLAPLTLSKAPTITGSTVPLTQGVANPLRILVPIGEATSFPTMCVIEGHETYPSASAGSPRAAANQPQLITLAPYVWIYTQAKQPDAIPNQGMNALLDAIDKVMLPADGRSWQHLGLRGVHHCRIEGQDLRAPGIDGSVSARLQFGIEVMQGVDTVPF